MPKNQDAEYSFALENSGYQLDVCKMDLYDAIIWNYYHRPKAGVGSQALVWSPIVHYYATKILNSRARASGYQGKYDKYENFILKIGKQPLGFFIIVNDYACEDSTNRVKVNNFIWYIAKNNSRYGKKARSKIKLTNKELISVFSYCYAIMYARRDRVESHDRAWLHADEQGGDSLLGYYKRIGLVLCNPKQDKHGKIEGTLRDYDRRYFYTPNNHLKDAYRLIFAKEIL